MAHERNVFSTPVATSPEVARQHTRLYFGFVALGLSLLSIGVYLLVSRAYAQAAVAPNALFMAVIVASTSVVFYRFRLLLSARETGYMLAKTIPPWLRSVLYVSLAYAMIPGVSEGVPQPVLVGWAVATLPITLLALYLMRLTATRFYASDERQRDAVFINPGAESLLLAQRLRRTPALGFQVAGYYGAPTNSAQGQPASQPLMYLGDVSKALEDLSQGEYEAVFLSLDAFKHPEWVKVIESIADTTASMYVVPEARALANHSVTANAIAGIPVLTIHETPILGMARILKRAMDIVLSLLGLVLLAPLMAVIALAVRISSPGPVFFKQVRYGHSGQAINVYKFRTMYVHQPDGELKQATRDDARITPVGRVLRRLSLDELPQLINVLLGHMSLVGPRPHAAEHNELYRKLIHGYMLRYSVKPGLTGWAQVNGLRGETDTIEKMVKRVEYDRYYIQNWSLWLDIKILFRTALLIVFDKHAY